MADGDEVSGRSDKCQPCLRKGKHYTTVKFCDTCQMSLCSACLGYHNALFDHLQVQGQGAEGAGSCIETDESTELCGDHNLPITLYCNEENTFGCVTCMDADHKSCKQVIYLPVSAKALLQDIDDNHLNLMIAKTIQELEAIKLKQQPQLQSLIEDREKCVKSVTDYHTRLLGRLNAIFRNTIDAIGRQFEVMRTEIESNIQHVEKSLADLNISWSRVQQFQSKHVQKFIEVTKCQKYVKEAEAVSTVAAQSLKIDGMDVIIDKRMDTLLTDLKSLATEMRRVPIQVKRNHTVDASVDKDAQPCDIVSACLLQDGSLLLIDNTNKRAKRLAYETLQICDTFSSRNKLVGVCCVDENQVILTDDNQKLTFVSINPTMSMIRKRSVEHHCGYIAYSKNELFITDLGKTLYVYTMQCSLLRKIVTDPSGINLFSTARHVVVNDTGDLVYVADWENGLLILNRNGMVVDRVNNLKFRGTRGVYLDDIGGAFVIGFASNKVVNVNQEGNVISDVLTEADGLALPKCVCFDKTKRQLFVCQEGSKKMIVCELI